MALRLKPLLQLKLLDWRLQPGWSRGFSRVERFDNFLKVVKSVSMEDFTTV